MMPYVLKADLLLYIPDCNKGRPALQWACLTTTIIQDLSYPTYSGNGFRLWFTRKLDPSEAIRSWCDHCYKVRFLNYTAIAIPFLSSSEGTNNPIYSGIYCPAWDEILRNNTVRDWGTLSSALTAGSKKHESKFLRKKARKFIKK